MKACLQGVRDYNDALKDGRIAGPNAEEIIEAIARYSVTKDRDLIRTVIPAALHPDGEVNVDGLAKDLAFIKTLGLVKSKKQRSGHRYRRPCRSQRRRRPNLDLTRGAYRVRGALPCGGF
jgi:hypothetical protein